MVKTLLGLFLSLSINNTPITTINYLIEHSLTRDQQIVVIEAEVIGEVLERGDFAWLNVNDGTNAIGVYTDIDLTSQLTTFGDYFHVGDKIRIVARFERSCLEHGGEMDLHATSITVIKKGYATEHEVTALKFVLSIILMAMAIAALYLQRNVVRKQKIGPETN